MMASGEPFPKDFSVAWASDIAIEASAFLRWVVKAA
jgi:hypothetical protein